MAAFVALVLAGAAVLAILSPFLGGGRERGAREGTAMAGEVQHLLDRRETLLRAMQDLAHDHRLGNLSDDEHAQLRTECERETILVLRDIDARAAGMGIGERIEAEVEARRAERAAAAGAGAKADGA
ncbi:MAG: hypothetical protein EXR49_08335 [Dehalococcoidia bacterium]|nr:hypothetical protein [Dehalococcoidia bacterium]